MTTRASAARDRVVPLGHSTVVVDLAGVRVITDPVLRRRVAFLERVVPPPGIPSGVDAVLISHLHHDHCDLPSLSAVLARSPASSVVVVPPGAWPLLGRRLGRNVVELAIGDRIDIGPVTITAVPAVHDGRREPWGPRAQAVGYVLATAANGRTVYFAGDTDLFSEMSGLVPSLDVALLPIWGWGPRLGPGHLDPDRAAEAAARLAPATVVPIHHGTFLPIGLRALPVGTRTLTRPALDFQDAARRRGLPMEISTTPWGQEVPWTPQRA